MAVELERSSTGRQKFVVEFVNEDVDDYRMMPEAMEHEVAWLGRAMS